MTHFRWAFGFDFASLFSNNGPANLVLPSRPTGIASVGQPLTSPNTGSWSGKLPISFQRQWFRADPIYDGLGALLLDGHGDIVYINAADISGATASAYTTVAADQDKIVGVRVTATNSKGSASVNSLVTNPIVQSDVSLFIGSNAGFLFDFSRLDQLWQFTSFGTPVTGDGQAIGRAQSIGPGALLLSQGTASNKPLYKTGGFARFDGSNDILQSTQLASAAGTLAFKGAVGALATRTFLGSTNNVAARAHLGLDASGKLAAGLGSNTITTIVGGSDIRGTTGVGILKWDGTTVTLRWNGTVIYTGAQAGVVPASHVMYVGGLNQANSAVQFASVDMYKAMFINRALTSGEETFLTTFWS